MNGRRMHGKRQAAGGAAGGVLRSAVAASTTFHRQQKKQSLCGWPLRKPASTAIRSTPPAALSTRSALASHKPSSFGRHPPLGGGRMLAHSPFSKYRATISRQSSTSTIIPEEPASRTFPQHMVVRKRDHAPAALRDIPAGARQICDFGCNSPGVGAVVPAGEKEQTPIRPMPLLTLRRCVPNASFSCSNVRKDGCPGEGHPSLRTP
jgi:hypothetical protein